MKGRKLILLLAAFFLVLITYLVVYNSPNCNTSNSNNNFSDNVTEIKSDNIDLSDNKPISLSHSNELDLISENYYLFSFNLKIDEFPELERREKLITKYNASSTPPIGWLIAIKHINSSTKLEVFLMDESGAGGWLTFAPMTLEPHINYRFTIILKVGGFISSYLINDIVPQITNLGTYPLDEIKDIKSSSGLKISSANAKYNKFRGEISNFTIFTMKNALKQSEVEKLFSKNAEDFYKDNNYSCIISFNENIRDCKLNSGS